MSLISVAGRMLVDHRRANIGVPEPRHKFLERRASGRQQGAARVPEVVDVQVGQADCFLVP